MIYVPWTLNTVLKFLNKILSGAVICQPSIFVKISLFFFHGFHECCYFSLDRLSDEPWLFRRGSQKDCSRRHIDRVYCSSHAKWALFCILFIQSNWIAFSLKYFRTTFSDVTFSPIRVFVCLSWSSKYLPPLEHVCSVTSLHLIFKNKILAYLY